MTQRRNPLLLLGASVLFLVLLLFFLYILSPAEERTAQLQGRMDAQEKLNEALSSKLQERTEETNGRPADGVQAELPYWDNTEQLLLDLEKAGEEAGVTHMSLAFNGDLVHSRPLADETEKAAASSMDRSEQSGQQLELGDDADMAEFAETTTDSQSADGSQSQSTVEPLRLQVSAVVKGNYDDVLAYVERLHKLERITTLESLELNRGTDASQELTVPLTFTAYFQPSYRKQIETPLLPYAESSVQTPPRS
ncbi:type 4a pilus biogenesis protein PilO [Paenibacillus pasadenensis]|uniref:type 4a pilus biogenesis protein PilO n=1 Tax=Paenibacillus pasadenensis TaxID=217090 RepID=UPI00203BACC8|nr:type 4a pilus biogenesis protein PilO [Paenibacillus pasadenensis]MCM3750070.1 type 4a pilus biogenesis protein PilO [Paenibacillus pasadenensis]